jgi:hypothetical protein
MESIIQKDSGKSNVFYERGMNAIVHYNGGIMVVGSEMSYAHLMIG